jgi:urease accessory protein UreF
MRVANVHVALVTTHRNNKHFAVIVGMVHQHHHQVIKTSSLIIFAHCVVANAIQAEVGSWRSQIVDIRICNI